MNKSRNTRISIISIALILLVLVVYIYSFASDRAPRSKPYSPSDLTAIDTIVSSKPRDRIVEYQVREGDTTKSIAEKFDISEDTVRWANNLQGQVVLHPGQTLKIPPVTGVVHTVTEGETVESIASMYYADPDNIINFPFNDFENFEAFALTPGQILYVPEGKR